MTSSCSYWLPLMRLVAQPSHQINERKTLNKQHTLHRKFVVVIVGVAALVLATATPALAVTGSGSGTGEYTIVGTGISGPPQPCAFIEEFSYVGTFTGTLGGYSGPITIEFEATSTFYEGPLGTHGQDSTCDPSTVGRSGRVPIVGSVTGTSGNDSVTCDFGGDEYWRVSMADTTAELDGECTTVVPGGTSVTDSPTSLIIEGVIGECQGQAPPDSCESVDAYVAT